MKRLAVVLSLCLLANVALAQNVESGAVPPNDPVPQPLSSDANGPLTVKVSREKALAAESFRLAAGGVLQIPDAKVPGSRAALLAMASEELDPTDRGVHRMLADFMEITGFRQKAAYQAMLCLRADPNDYSAGLRWLDRSLVLMQGAQARHDFLADVAQRDRLPQPLRAEARARQGLLLSRQGLQRAAISALEEALKQDPLNPTAISELARIRGENDPTRLVPLQVKMLRGNPMSAQAAWSLGGTLGSQGVHDDALAFLDYAWLVSQRKTSGGDVPMEYVMNYAGAMLDANEPTRVVKTFAGRLDGYEPVFMVKNIHEPWDLRVQMIEAYRMAEMDANAARLVQSVASDYAARAEKAETSIQLARQIAMFHAITVDNWSAAAPFIRISERIDTNNPDVQALAGMLRIKNGQADAGEKLLRKAMPNSVWANALLADYYYGESKLRDAAKAVRQAARMTRRGWAFRHLRRVVRKHDAEIPPGESADRLKADVKELIETYLPAWTQPERMLAVTVKPVREAAFPTENIEVDITLKNTGKLAIPMGNWGLLSPAFALRVSLEDPAGKKITFDRLPMVTLPSPRYLQPGESISQRGYVNVGPLRAELMSRPMESITLTIEAIMDPVVVEKKDTTKLYTPLPTVPVAPVKVTRRPLAELYPSAKRSTAKDSFLYLVAHIVRDMRRGDTAKRMRSARIAGSLLAMAQRVDAGKLSAPEGVRKQWLSGYAMSMMRELLDPDKQSSFAVRAELLGALRFVKLNSTTKKLLGATFDDPSPYVRLRLVEIVGSDDQVSFRRSIRRLAEDDSELVRSLVAAFRQAR